MTHESGCSICDDYRSHRGRAASRRDRDFEAAEAQREMWRSTAHPYEIGYQQGRIAGSTDMEMTQARFEHQIRLTREAEEREVAARRALQAAERRADEMERELARVRVELSIQRPAQQEPPARPQEAQPKGYAETTGTQSRVPQGPPLARHAMENETDPMYDSEAEEEVPPEITRLRVMSTEAWNNPGGHMEMTLSLMTQEAKKLAPHLRSLEQLWLLKNWKPRSLQKEAEREHCIRRRMDEVTGQREEGW